MRMLLCLQVPQSYDMETVSSPQPMPHARHLRGHRVPHARPCHVMFKAIPPSTAGGDIYLLIFTGQHCQHARDGDGAGTPPCQAQGLQHQRCAIVQPHIYSEQNRSSCHPLGSNAAGFHRTHLLSLNGHSNIIYTSASIYILNISCPAAGMGKTARRWHLRAKHPIFAPFTL